MRHLAINDEAVGALGEKAIRPELVDIVPDARIAGDRPQVDENERVARHVVSVERGVGDCAVRQRERHDGGETHHLEYGRLGARYAQALGVRGRAFAADDGVDVALDAALLVRVDGHVEDEPEQRRRRRVGAGRDELDRRAQ